MAITSNGTRDQPQVASSGNTPDFAADLTGVSDFFAVRSLRRFSTVALLLASSGSSTDDYAVATNAPGAFWRNTGSGWTMYGVAHFASAAARTTAITAPVAGMRSRRADYWCDEEYNGTSWIPVSKLIIPTAATNGSVSATGVVTSTAQSLVRIRDCFLFPVVRVVFDITLSAASGATLKFAVDATDASTAYDSQRTTSLNATVAAAQTLAGTSGELSAVGVAGARHFGEVIITDANVAGPSYWTARAVVAPPAAMTTATGMSMSAGLHRTSTAYNSLTIAPGSGNVTINRLTVEGVS